MAISRHSLLKARLALVRRDLDQAIEHVTQETMEWAPRQGMRTVAGQFVEIIGTEMQLVARLRDDRYMSDDDAKAVIGDCASLENLCRSLKQVREETLGFLDSLSESELLEEVEFGAGWFASLMLPTVPRAEVFLNIADHEWYHVGQLTSYLWMRGEEPYEW